MEEINRFVVLVRSGRFSVTDLCEQFGISRKTKYKHLERYAEEGLAGLKEEKRVMLKRVMLYSLPSGRSIQEVV